MALWVTLALLLLVPGAGCGGDAYDPQLEPCRCELEVCSAVWCGYELRLHPSCNESVELAEILIDDHLETEILVPGETVFPCTRTPPGETSRITVRGGGWIWGPLERDCGVAGNKVHTLIFECTELEGFDF